MALRTRVTLAAGLSLALVGCSGSADLNAKPDSTLTYDLVAKDVTKYRGKRVRWLGQFANGSVKDKALGKGSFLDAVFVDNRTDLRIELRAFAVEGESDKGNIDFMFDIQGKPVWVVGTIAGTRRTKMTVGPPPEEKELDVPLLRNAVFEPESTPNTPAPTAGPKEATSAATAPLVDPGQEKLALQLLGSASTYSGANCQDFSSLSLIMESTKKTIATDGISAFRTMVSAAGAKCPGYTLTLTTTAEPDVAAVVKLLGETPVKEDGVLRDRGSDVSVVWHKYGWLHFAVTDGRVVAVRGDSGQLPARGK